MRQVFVLIVLVCGVMALAHPTPLMAQGEGIQNGAFDQGLTGWQTFATDAVVREDGQVDYGQSFFAPTFKMADDRQINGATLQIDAVEYTRWQAGVYQTVNVAPGATVQGMASVLAYTLNSDGARGVIFVRLGLDPQGRPNCAGATWGEPVPVGHLQQTCLSSPRVQVASEGRATVCVEGTVQYPYYKGALFVDDVTATASGGVLLSPAAGAQGAAVSTPLPPDPVLAGVTGGSPQAPAATGGTSWGKGLLVGVGMGVVLLLGLILSQSSFNAGLEGGR